MADMKKYSGGCHCGRVRFEAAADLERVITCNCSICSKRGSILTFSPAEQFKLISGENDLIDYQFHKNVIHHLFCSTCGTESFSRGQLPDGTKMVALNVRCLEGVDLDKLSPTQVNGKKF